MAIALITGSLSQGVVSDIELFFLFFVFPKMDFSGKETLSKL
jgi:hypothetical protein